MRYIIAFLILIISSSLNAQDNLLKNADKKFQDKLYNKAIELYDQAFNENPGSYYIAKRLAISNQRIGNTVESEKWMRILFAMERATSADILMYSELLLENGKFKPAREYLEKYANAKPDDKRVEEKFKRIEYIESIVKDSSAFEIRPVAVNTPGAELGVCFYNNSIIFSSTSLTGNKSDEKLLESNLPFLDLYTSEELKPGKLSTPKPFAPKLKTRFNDGPITYDQVDNLFYITQYAPKQATEMNGESVFHLQIVVAEEKNGEWDIKNDFFLNSPDYSVAHPTISHDGKVIYFVSDMRGGYGGYDIYFCFKDSAKWSEPYNLGPVVNTKMNEFFPFIDSRGHLYFSSEGHPGLGAQDIFIATSENGVFNNVRNAGFPLNSPKDDVAFVLDNSTERGYISSNRVGTLGYYDIFSVAMSYIPVTIKGIVKDIDSKSKLEGVNIKLTNEKGANIANTVTKPDGTFSVLINKVSTMDLSVSKNDFEILQKKVGIDFLKPDEELKLEIFLRKK